MKTGQIKDFVPGPEPDVSETDLRMAATLLIDTIPVVCVAAPGCRLRSVDAATPREVLGVAEYHGLCSQMMHEIANPTILHDGSGMGALAALVTPESEGQNA